MADRDRHAYKGDTRASRTSHLRGTSANKCARNASIEANGVVVVAAVVVVVGVDVADVANVAVDLLARRRHAHFNGVSAVVAADASVAVAPDAAAAAAPDAPAPVAP